MVQSSGYGEPQIGWCVVEAMLTKSVRVHFSSFTGLICLVLVPVWPRMMPVYLELLPLLVGLPLLLWLLLEVVVVLLVAAEDGAGGCEASGGSGNIEVESG